MKKNYFWGVFLILAGAYLIVSQMGYLPRVDVFTSVATIVCIAALIHSVLHLSFGGILFPLAFIGILYDEPLGITAITPWAILLAALLGTIGLNILFANVKAKRHFKHKHKKEIEMGMEKGESVEGENIYLKSSFGSLIRYVTSTDFRYAAIESNFSGVKVYFDNAVVPTGNATIELDSNFSGVEFYIPDNWQIVNHLDSTFGGISEKNKRTGEAAVTLTLEGENTFSGVTIYYV